MFGVGAPPTRAKELPVKWRARLADCAIALAFHPGQPELLAAAEAAGPVHQFLGPQGQRGEQLRGHASGTMAISWHPREMQLASAGQDGLVRLWNGQRGDCLWEHQAGKSAAKRSAAPWAEHVAFSPSGLYLAAGCGKRLSVLTANGQLVMESDEHQSTIAHLQWRPGTAKFQKEVLATCAYGGLSFWAPADNAPALTKFPYKGSMLHVEWSPDGKYIGTGNQDATIQFWMMPKGLSGDIKDLVMWGYRSKIVDMAWSPDSRFLATGGSATVIVWDCSGAGPAGRKPLLLDFHGQLLTELAWQPNGALLASGCQEGLVALWRPGKQEQPVATQHFEAPITQLRWSADGRHLAVGTEAGVVAVAATHEL